jgi:hypothetical protein
VILLENSNEWNLTPAKEGSSKREREREREKREKKEREKRSKDWKAKEVKPHMKKLLVSNGEKKKRMKFTSYWERFYWKKERKKGDHIFL